MKLALLVGVRDDHPQQRLLPGPGLAAIEQLLVSLDGWTITRIENSAASRTGILEGLRAIEQTIGPDDTFVFYFFGHGGVVEIEDLSAPLGGRPVFYLASARADTQWSFEAVLDVELSLALARIDAICGNVSVVLDCCHGARTVRGPAWKLHTSPAWVREVAERTRFCDALLAPESHPTIVRLAASSSLRWAFAEEVIDGHLGHLTRSLVEVVHEAHLRVDRLTWDTVAHRVRERVIWRMGCEEQWVTLAGPRERLLFSHVAAPPMRTTSFVPHESKSGGWIRAGALQGVRVGDQWGLAALTLDDALRPRWAAHMRVSAVELNRAVLEPIGVIADRLAPGTSAHLLGARMRRPIGVDGPVELSVAVARSSLICAASEHERPWLAKLCVDGATIDVRPHAPGLPRMRLPAGQTGVTAAVELLEDWARALLLREVVASQPVTTSPTIRVSWGRAGERTFTIEGTTRMHVGERIDFRIRHVGGHGEWFVCAVEIGVDGRPRLLNASEPEGHELRPGETIHLGRRAHRRRDGFPLTWPAELPRDGTRPVTVLFFASPRPIQFGHLVSSKRRDDSPVLQGFRRRPRARSHLAEPRPRIGPEPIREWTWQAIDYELDPDPLT